MSTVTQRTNNVPTRVEEDAPVPISVLFPPELDDLLDAEAGIVPDELDDLRASLRRYQRQFRLEPDSQAADIVLDAISAALADLEAFAAETRAELNAARRHDLQEALEQSYERGLRAGPGVSSHHLAN